MAAFFKLALRIHKLCHILLSGDSHRETRSGVDYAVYADDVLLHRPPLHFQITYKNVADAKTTSATSAAILRGHLHTICIVAAVRCRTAPDDTGRHRPVPSGAARHRTAPDGAVRSRAAPHRPVPSGAVRSVNKPLERLQIGTCFCCLS